MSIFMFYMLLFYVIVCYNKHWSGAYESTYNKIQKMQNPFILQNLIPKPMAKHPLSLSVNSAL